MRQKSAGLSPATVASGELPDVVADERRGGAVRVEPVDGHVRPADHEVRVHAGDVEAEVEQLLVGLVAPQVDRVADRAPEGDVAALEEALQRVSALIGAIPELMEMDLNPVKVLAPGDGVVVVDARMRVEPVAPGRLPAMRDLPGVTSNPPL